MRLLNRLGTAFGLATALALLAGCGANRDATEKALAELRAEVNKLRAAQAALGERVEGIEIARGTFKSAAPAASGQAAAQDHPDLAVVRLSPSEGDGDADNEAPRPVIRAVGNDGSILRGKTKEPRGKRGVTPAATPKKSDAHPTVKP